MTSENNDKKRGSNYGGSHVRKSSRVDVAYYEKNRSPLAKLQARQTHKRGTAMFSQYDTSAIQPKKKGGAKVAIIVAIIVVVVAAVLWFTNIFGLLPSNAKADVEPGVAVEVTIPQGSATKAISTILYDSDVIENENKFLAVVNDKGAASALKPGTYSLTTLMDTDELVNLLIKGPTFTGQKLTIPEGKSIEETSTLVEQATGISASEFLTAAKSAQNYSSNYPFLANCYNNSMEGYLFPKTYDIQKGDNADAVIKTMLDQFNSEISSLGISSSGANGHSLAEIVNVASMVQDETSVVDEMPKVASVIYNRLSQGIPLQIDATVVYALGESYTGAGKVTYDDLEVDSPYNTYKNSGLPAGPINSPGSDALKAAANPENTSYLYYLSTNGSTTHQFFEDYDSFLNAKGGQ